MSIILTILTIGLLFSATIFVHELGHYLAARWMGLVIDAFSIGMGPAIWKKKYRGVVYKIGCLPIGGYVALPQLDPDLGGGEQDGKPRRELPALPSWRKIPVQVAGVIGNIIFAFIIAFIVYQAGEGPAYRADGAVVGYVSTNSPAYEAGIRMGDRIERVDGTEIGTWDGFVIECALHEQVDLDIVAADGSEKSIRMETEALPSGGRLIRGVEKSLPCLVLDVRKGGSAEDAGMRRGDVITSFNGIPVMGTSHLITLVDQHSGQTVPITVARDGDEIELEVTPTYSQEFGRALIGIEFNHLDIHRKPLDQIAGWASPVFRILKALGTPSEARNAAEALGGPVSIFSIFWMSARTSFLLALWFTGLINVNLAIINMLPIPILDGGHLLLTLIEIVGRRPVDAKIKLFVYKLFMVLLIAAFLLITLNDFRRLLIENFGGRDQSTQENQ